MCVWVYVECENADVKWLQLLIPTALLFNRPHKTQSTNKIIVLKIKVEFNYQLNLLIIYFPQLIH